MPTSYLTDDEFKLRTLLPSTVVDGIESKTPGWLRAQIIGVSARVEARLGKRYPVWVAPDYPEALKQWVVDIVSANAWLKRGMSQTDDAFAEFKNRHDQAYDEIKEAANSDTGLFDLQRTVDGAQSSAIEYGGSHCYSEQSPYAALDRQARIGRGEDRGGNGGTST
jgi:hypothetical protein